MADKVPQGMSDRGSLRDPNKMVSNSHRLMYAVIALVVLAFVGLTVYSVTDSTPPDQTPPASTPQ